MHSPGEGAHGHGTGEAKSWLNPGSEVDFGFNDKFVADLEGGSEKLGSDQMLDFQRTDEVVCLPRKPVSQTQKYKGSNGTGLNVDVGSASDRYIVEVPKIATLTSARMGK